MTTKEYIEQIQNHSINGSNIRPIKKIGFKGSSKYHIHSHAKKILKQIADLLGFQKDSYSIKILNGGDGVQGETILHHEKLYICLCEPINNQFMWRSCKGLKDHTGGTNQWINYSELNDLTKLVEHFKKGF